ncbi:MAG: hypothetical protein IPN20_13000 [Haliscomenobacter sp.]|nr:hypothetical protein [Haliscomenobacter sp.]MBP9874286.1 hypothetical protein [Haliscomenobacter sp.]
MKNTNTGGINGLGESLINTNSEEFKALKRVIEAHYGAQDERVKMENGLLSVRFQMESYLNAEGPVDHIQPAGFFIERFLQAAKVSKKQFSNYIQYEYSNFIALIKGRRRINSELAIKLGQIFKVDPAVWLHIESKNELLLELTKTDPRLSLEDLIKEAS